MANTFELISSVTVPSGGASNITFNSIPSTFKDIYVLVSCRGTGTGQSASLKYEFNGSSSNQYMRYVSGANSIGYESGQGASMYAGEISGNTGTANTFGNVEIYIPNYASSEYKTSLTNGVQENNSAAAYSTFSNCQWTDTSAITSIRLYLNIGNMAEFSTAYLYGIKNS